MEDENLFTGDEGAQVGQETHDVASNEIQEFDAHFVGRAHTEQTAPD